MRRTALVGGGLLALLAGCGDDGEVRVPSAAPTVAQATAPAAGTTAATAPPARTLPQGGAEGGSPAVVRRPPIVQWRIPFGAKRRADMAAYSRRHYGIRDWRLRSPKLLVQHWTQVGTVRATRAIFRPNRPDGELRELPGTCAHFVIARSGTIYQLVDLGTQCRHAFGVNWTSVGIEHIGFSDSEVMGNRRQLAASLALSRWLRCRSGIPVSGAIGHAETTRSPFWRERDPRQGRSTHSDFRPAAMRAYRAALAKRPCE